MIKLNRPKLNRPNEIILKPKPGGSLAKRLLLVEEARRLGISGIMYMDDYFLQEEINKRKGEEK